MVNSVEQLTIENTLRQLGLIDSEIAIFLLWLENGALTIAQLAELSQMGRITVHEIVGRLIKKWLFLETRSWHKRLVYPNQVDALENLVAEEKFKVQKLEKAAKKASSLLRDMQLMSESFPKTKFYKGQEGIQRMINEIKKDKNDVSIMSDGQHFYSLIDNDFLDQTVELRIKKGIKVRLLFPSGFEYFTYTQWTYQQELEIKSLPDADNLHGGMTLRWDKVALHCYEGKYITTTIIHNAPISLIQKYMFEQVWGNAKEY